jgi:HD-GYP domain-containing protein (c-di-GMP phosphodiesterase class II)
MKNKSNIYAVVVTAAAAVFLFLSFPGFYSTLQQDTRGVAIWFVLLSVTGVLTFVALRGGGAVAGTAVVNFAIIITYGGEVAAWLIAIEMLFLTRVLLRYSTARSLFNMSQMAIALALAGMVYGASGGQRLAVDSWNLNITARSLLPLALCHLTYFFINTGLVAVWTSINQHRSVIRTWRAAYLWMLPQSFTAPLVGVVMAFIYVRLSLMLLLVFFLWLVYYARSSKANLELQASQRGTVAALATTVDSSTPFLEGESERVAALAVEIGRRIGLSGWRMQTLEYAALLHDIGYLSIGKRILSKGDCLSVEEWNIVRRHAEVGAGIIGRVAALRRVSQVVKAHHERPDGRGYPDGLRRDQIPRESGVLKVADAFVAMTTDRPYRRAMSAGDALKKIRSGAGTHFDTQAVRGLIELNASSALGQFSAAVEKAA